MSPLRRRSIFGTACGIPEAEPSQPQRSSPESIQGPARVDFSSGSRRVTEVRKVHQGGPENGQYCFKGVRQRRWGKWVAEIKHPEKSSRIWLGTYANAQEAAKAYNEAAVQLYGSRAKLNDLDKVNRDNPVNEVNEVDAVDEEAGNSKTLAIGMASQFCENWSHSCLETQATEARPNGANSTAQTVGLKRQVSCSDSLDGSPLGRQSLVFQGSPTNMAAPLEGANGGCVSNEATSCVPGVDPGVGFPQWNSTFVAGLPEPPGAKRARPQAGVLCQVPTVKPEPDPLRAVDGAGPMHFPSLPDPAANHPYKGDLARGDPFTSPAQRLFPSASLLQVQAKPSVDEAVLARLQEAVQRQMAGGVLAQSSAARAPVELSPWVVPGSAAPACSAASSAQDLSLQGTVGRWQPGGDDRTTGSLQDSFSVPIPAPFCIGYGTDAGLLEQPAWQWRNPGTVAEAFSEVAQGFAAGNVSPLQRLRTPDPGPKPEDTRVAGGQWQGRDSVWSFVDEEGDSHLGRSKPSFY